MKKIIVLIISILLPIVAAVAVGAYGYNVRYNPFNPNNILASQIQGEFLLHLNDGITTSQDRINNYMKLENYLYSSDPLYKKDVTDEEGTRLFTIAIYRHLEPYKPSADVEKVLNTRFEVYVYNANYTKIKEYFHLDDPKIIEDAGMPYFTIEFVPTNNRDSLIYTLAQGNDNIPDYDSIPEYANEKSETKNFVQDTIFRERQFPAKFSSDVNIKIKAFLKITSGGDTNNLEADHILLEDYIEDFEYKAANLNEEDYEKGFNVAIGENDNLKKKLVAAGLNKWIFTKYIWWQALIGFALVGLVTMSFCFIFFAEEKEETEKAAKKKKKR